MTLVVALLLLAGHSRGAGGYALRIGTDPESKIDVEVTSFMATATVCGYYPMRIRIANHSDGDGSWTLGTERYRSIGELKFDTTLSVPAGTEREFEVLVPVSSRSDSPYRTAPYLRVEGPGVDSGSFQPNLGGSNSARDPWVGMSDELHSDHWGDYGKKVKDLGGGALDVSQLSANWKAYAGLDQICLRGREWKNLSGDVKTALKEWVALGGDLRLVCDTNEEAAQVASDFSSANQYGLGQVDTTVGKLSFVGIGEFVRAAQDAARVRSANDSSTERMARVGETRSSSLLVMVFIVAFGIVAGPLNLFVFAGPGRRHRLFWTTPLISLLGAMILGGVILLQDGTGGTGVRLVRVAILPDVKRMVVVQTQVSRTGLLVGKGFQLGDSAWLQLTGNHDSQSYRSSSLQADSSGYLSGDWFRSRSTQTMRIKDSQPSRAAVEFVPGAEPGVISAIDATLDEIYVVAPDGKVWTARDVVPGQRVPLQAATTSSLREGVQAWTKRWNPIGAQHAGAHEVDVEPGNFVGWMEKGGETLATPTLDSIEWEVTPALLTGKLTLTPGSQR